MSRGENGSQNCWLIYVFGFARGSYGCTVVMQNLLPAQMQAAFTLFICILGLFSCLQVSIYISVSETVC